MQFANILGVLAASLFFTAAAAQAQPQSSAQQRCITAVNEAAAKVAKLQGKENYGCLRLATAASMATDGDTCMRADLRSRIAKARSKVLITAGQTCASGPDFGFTDVDTITDAAVDQDIALVGDFFSDDLASGALLSDSNRDGARCQTTALRAADGAMKAKLKAFGKCLKLGLKQGTIVEADDIAGCIGVAGGHITASAGKTLDKLAKAVTDKCAGQTASAAFAGSCASSANTATLSSCLQTAVECRFCTMTADMFSLDFDCDGFDDGIVNGSCGSGISVSTTTTVPFDTVCGNDADEAIAAEFDLLVEATNCTFDCLFDGDLPGCVGTCVSGATGLSPDCALCYGQSSQCGIGACTVECAADQSAPECTACLDVNCIPAFDVCSGVPIIVTTTLFVSTTTTTTTTLDTVTTTTTSAPTTTTTLPLAGFCTGEADTIIRETADVDDATRTCTFSCLSAPDVAVCIGACVATETGLTSDCALCYGESAECGIMNCAALCAADPNGEPCLSCVQANCSAAQNACIGTPPTTTTTLDTTTTTSTTTTIDTTTTTLPAVTGACTNATDDVVHENFVLLDEAVTCTIACLSDPSRESCIQGCLVTSTGATAECSGCYAASSECGLQNCAGQCAIDQSAPPCLACLDTHCFEAFDDCTGFGDPPLPASCSNVTQDGDETDVDCGGTCSACVIGQGCSVVSDCVSGECVGGACSAPTTALAFGSCANGYIDPFSDVDALDLGAFGTGADDGYVVTLPSTTDVFLQLTNQEGSTAIVQAALVSTAGDATSTAAGLATGAVIAGQNGTAGPANVPAGTYYLYVDADTADTFGPYDVCLLAAPTVELGSCVSASVGNGDGNDVELAGVGGDKGFRFVSPSSTNVIVKLRNLSGASTMAAAIYNGGTQVASSSTGATPLYTQRAAGQASVSAGTNYVVQVDTADVDSFGSFELCVVEAGCGDGIRTGSESCDDGNNVGGDGCTSSCGLESGKIVVDSCRTSSISALFGDDCETWTLPILQDEGVFMELTNPAGDTLLAEGAIREGGTELVATGDVQIAQSGSTAVANLTAGGNYNVRICDVTGAGIGTFTTCVRRARKVELGSCYAGNVSDGDGNRIDLAGPISGGDEDVIFQPPRDAIVRLDLTHQGGGGLLAAGVYDGQPNNLLAGSAVGASPAPIASGASGSSGLFEVNNGQIYRVYTDIASLGTGGTNYQICLTEVAGDACLNDDDELVRSSVNLDEVAESTGLSCTGGASCISTAMQEQTGLSAGCADCYGGTGSCAASNCAFQCIGDSGSSGCRSCVASSCAQEFDVCSGWVYGD